MLRLKLEHAFSKQIKTDQNYEKENSSKTINYDDLLVLRVLCENEGAGTVLKFNDKLQICSLNNEFELAGNQESIENLIDLLIIGKSINGLINPNLFEKAKLFLQNFNDSANNDNKVRLR